MNMSICRKSALIMTLVLFIFPVLFSCSRAEPRILHGFIELVYYSGRERPDERYSFFVLIEDDDGVENLSELYLHHDRDGLFWLISSKDWVKHEEDGKTWIGSRSIAMQGDGPLPRGQYRAVLINKGGEKTERRFTYDGPERSPYPFPDFTVIEDSYRVTSQYPVNRLICYDQQGRTVQTVEINGAEGSIRELRLANSVRTAALWAADPEHHISALTDAASMR